MDHFVRLAVMDLRIVWATGYWFCTGRLTEAQLVLVGLSLIASCHLYAGHLGLHFLGTSCQGGRIVQGPCLSKNGKNILIQPLYKYTYTSGVLM